MFHNTNSFEGVFKYSCSLISFFALILLNNKNKPNLEAHKNSKVEIKNLLKSELPMKIKPTTSKDIKLKLPMKSNSNSVLNISE